VQRGSIVLIDANAIIEAHRVRIWNALSKAFEIHTVEKVVMETQEGAHNRHEGNNIVETELRTSLAYVHPVTEAERAVVHAIAGGVLLDDGELDLLAYAHTLGASKVWLLNSPDKASVRYCHQRKWQDSVVSLEEMNTLIGLERALKFNYTSKWLSDYKLDLYMGRL
jgi:hypothetical protein